MNMNLIFQIPKELQYYLKNKAKGYTDEMDYMRLEKEMAANKMSIDHVLQESAHRCEEIQVNVKDPFLVAHSFKNTMLFLDIVYVVHILTH